MGKLEGKVAVVTGGNSGIGRATAELFAREGARVAIVGRSRDTLDEAARAIGGDVVAIRADVAKLDDLDRAFREVETTLGRIDVLFVNAGIAEFVPLADVDEAHFDRQFGVNVKGAFFTVQRALPLLVDGASIIFNASAAASLGLQAASVYSATKAAVRSLARTLSAELVGRGIRVNTISPGPIETPIFGRLGLPEDALDELSKQLVASVPMKRIGRADEIARAALFLGSADSSYVVGVDLNVDGGQTQL